MPRCGNQAYCGLSPCAHTQGIGAGCLTAQLPLTHTRATTDAGTKKALSDLGPGWLRPSASRMPGQPRRLRRPFPWSLRTLLLYHNHAMGCQAPGAPVCEESGRWAAPLSRRHLYIRIWPGYWLRTVRASQSHSQCLRVARQRVGPALNPVWSMPGLCRGLHSCAHGGEGPGHFPHKALTLCLTSPART